jgi:hypothetical protein
VFPGNFHLFEVAALVNGSFDEGQQKSIETKASASRLHNPGYVIYRLDLGASTFSNESQPERAVWDVGHRNQLLQCNNHSLNSLGAYNKILMLSDLPFVLIDNRPGTFAARIAQR